jgi:hypothetical protein
MRKTLLGLLLFTVSSTGCGSTNSVLEITLDPSAVSSVTMLATQTTIGDVSRTEDIGSQDGPPISLASGPSYTIEIPHQYSGAVQVLVDGLDATNTLVLSGTGSLPSLNVGHLNNVEVSWQPSP